MDEGDVVVQRDAVLRVHDEGALDDLVVGLIQSVEAQAHVGSRSTGGREQGECT